MAVINKEGIVRRLNDKTGDGLAKTHKLIDSLIEVIGDVTKEGHDVRIQNFGTFKLRHKDEREARVPSTGGTTLVPAHTVVKFIPAASFKALISDVTPLS